MFTLRIPKFVKGMIVALFETVEDTYIAFRDLTPLLVVAGAAGLFYYVGQSDVGGVLLAISFAVGMGLGIYRLNTHKARRLDNKYRAYLAFIGFGLIILSTLLAPTTPPMIPPMPTPDNPFGAPPMPQQTPISAYDIIQGFGYVLLVPNLLYAIAFVNKKSGED